MKNIGKFQLLDSAAYFLTEVERMVGPDYLPTEMDVLRARSITTGIVKVPFQVGSIMCEVSKGRVSPD